MDEQHLVPLEVDGLASDRDYVGICVIGGDLVDRRLDAIALEGSLLAKLRAAGITWSNLRLSEVAFRECDLANTVWQKAHAERFEASKCRLTGWNAAGCVLRSARFIGCKIDLAVFHGAALTDCRFENCNLVEGDFQSARLKNVTFRNCDLRNSRFAAAALGAVDFRGSHLAGIQLDADRLRGNVFDPSQLADIAQVLGLIVKEFQADEPNARR